MKTTLLIFLSILLFTSAYANKKPKQVTSKKSPNGGTQRVMGHFTYVGGTAAGHVFRCSKPLDQVCVYIVNKAGDDNSTPAQCSPEAVIDGPLIEPNAFETGKKYLGFDNDCGGITYTIVDTISIDCSAENGDIMISLTPYIDLP